MLRLAMLLCVQLVELFEVYFKIGRSTGQKFRFRSSKGKFFLGND